MEKLFSYLSASSFFSPFPEEIIAFIQPKDTSNTYREKDIKDDKMWETQSKQTGLCPDNEKLALVADHWVFKEEKNKIETYSSDSWRKSFHPPRTAAT